MNVYDFDKTIYAGDSTRDFYFFLLASRPSLLRFFPAAGFVQYGMRLISKTELKARFFRFLREVRVEDYLPAFWEGAQGRIYPWYLRQRREDDVVISASPEFLLRPICRRLGISRLIASRVDPRTGMFQGQNCYGEEKVTRFRSEFGAGRVERFYSDSLSDLPMARIAERAFLVKRGGMRDWARV